MAAFLVFGVRLAYLQLVQGRHFKTISESNMQRWVRVAAPRGRILDRKGREIATNVPGSAAWLVPGEIATDSWPQLLKRLTELGIYPDIQTARKSLEDFRQFPSYLPVRLASRMDIHSISRLVEDLPNLSGVYLRTEPVRCYPENNRASHLIGYLREIDPNELSLLRKQGYRLGDRLGKAGIERAYETVLRGVEGGEQVEVDARGRVLRTLRTVDPQPGTPVTLTLDLDVQRVAETAFGKQLGAAVALDPATGDVLALFSAPEYDLNAISGRISPQMLAWLRGSQRPELNRAASGMYPPGSIFKIVTAVAALEKGAVTPATYYYCSGSYHGIRCWKHSGHGAINLTGAIAHSCNVAFMQMAEKVGVRELAGMSRRFGLGEAVGLQPRVEPLLPNAESPHALAGIITEQRGLVPDPEWAKTVRKSPWMPGETLQMGMGQASLTVTPLQAACMTAAIANDGKRVHPRLVAAVGDEPAPIMPPTPLGLRPATVQQVKYGLRAVAGEGTARRLDPSLQIAGKTGTAQNPRGEDHAWFVGYAPADAPKIAVAVVVEHGGHGGATAAPIAEAIIRAALQGTED